MKIRDDMVKKILFFVIAVLVTAGALAGIILCEVSSVIWVAALCGVVFSIACGVAARRCQDLMDFEDWQSSLRKHLRGKLIKKDDFIRISFSYLFRVKVYDKYLLVFNGRGIGKYQPVGGAYKCNEEEKLVLTSSEFHVNDDNCIPIDLSSKNDYRMRVPEKNIRKFVNRFNTSAKRENLNNLSREFVEELIKPEILSKKNFSQIKYRYCGRHFSKIEYSKHFTCYELLLADVVELILNDVQEAELVTKQREQDSRVRWATEEEIINCGSKKGTKNLQETITDHTSKILQCNANNLTIKKSDEKTYLVEIK